ncbi:hypothetical protein F4809DRAFT_532916 [Biscogniauxia mediterranea]|nr:hypothetical protein F4809DRAFT_532916 [Biscogniauxia mediterranea]
MGTHATVYTLLCAHSSRYCNGVEKRQDSKSRRSALAWTFALALFALLHYCIRASEKRKKRRGIYYCSSFWGVLFFLALARRFFLFVSLFYLPAQLLDLGCSGSIFHLILGRGMGWDGIDGTKGRMDLGAIGKKGEGEEQGTTHFGGFYLPTYLPTLDREMDIHLKY